MIQAQAAEWQQHAMMDATFLEELRRVSSVDGAGKDGNCSERCRREAIEAAFQRAAINHNFLSNNRLRIHITEDAGGRIAQAPVVVALTPCPTW